MHPKLIKANIALFNGARTETRRLLEEYRKEAEDSKPTPMMLWLEAQAQETREARIERLHRLLEETGENNRYARYARAYIEDERKYSNKPLPGSRGGNGLSILGVSAWKAALFTVLGGALAFILFSVFNPGTGTVQNVTPSPSAATPGAILGDLATPLNLPNLSTPVAPELFQAQYARGVLQITSVENNSQRAADIRERVVLTPITGARFYALKLIFECRQGICANPPQARLLLELDDGSNIPAMDNVGITGENLFQPVAEGRSTNGWVVFEIPIDSTPRRLVIIPASTEATETPTPVFIDLSAL
ncbi:MAG TPA: hypothetical protein VK003_06605 [Oceanobacillus sp.]|nr:hypothetical protein [Oceanobacillus sp.]